MDIKSIEYLIVPDRSNWISGGIQNTVFLSACMSVCLPVCLSGVDILLYIQFICIQIQAHVAVCELKNYENCKPYKVFIVERGCTLKSQIMVTTELQSTVRDLQNSNKSRLWNTS